MRILIVDDNESLAESLSIGLERLGYTVETAQDGIEALERLKKNTYDVLLTDIKMPEMDGISLAKRVMEEESDMKIVMMSAYGFPKNSNGFIRIEKPFEIEDLLNALKLHSV